VRSIGVFYNPRADHAEVLAREIAVWVEHRGLRVQVGPTDGKTMQIDRLSQSDLLVTLGGDGTILRAARKAAICSTPILGVNLGRVGFLTEAEPDTWIEVLSQVLAREYWLEKRMMVRVEASRSGTSLAHADALNDVVVGRGARGRAVHLDTEVDGGALCTYVADGLIVATPTGSTAYALAAGGPVLPPELRNILLVPVAPHLSINRPVVLSEGVRVRVVVAGGRPALLTVDGEIVVDLASGDEVVVSASPHVAQFARVQERTYFYRTLVARLVPRG
jgi:NAD+ kinase